LCSSRNPALGLSILPLLLRPSLLLLLLVVVVVRVAVLMCSRTQWCVCLFKLCWPVTTGSVLRVLVVAWCRCVCLMVCLHQVGNIVQRVLLLLHRQGGLPLLLLVVLVL
jgi:hypothetical protein